MDTGQADDSRILDIAVGVLVDGAQRLLIARRRAGTPGAGRWEFPGGKQEPGESIEHALSRELAEEIGIADCRAEPVIRFAHDRGPRPVRLHVSRVYGWSGKPHGREGQQLRWATADALADVDLLPATDVILNALALPSRYLITPPLASLGERAWLAGIDRALAAGIRMIRLRDHALDDAAYATLAKALVAQAHARGAAVMLDRDAAMAAELDADGLHWPFERLAALGQRPQSASGLLAVSAHCGSELARAAALGADFATLSPVTATPSHPGGRTLGWPGWCAARADHALPVYALGGLGPADIARARLANAQGVAAIRGFWPEA